MYVNVDSPNLGFPYFNFLGEAQWEKKHPVVDYWWSKNSIFRARGNIVEPLAVCGSNWNDSFSGARPNLPFCQTWYLPTLLPSSKWRRDLWLATFTIYLLTIIWEHLLYTCLLHFFHLFSTVRISLCHAVPEEIPLWIFIDWLVNDKWWVLSDEWRMMNINEKRRDIVQNFLASLKS